MELIKTKPNIVVRVEECSPTPDTESLRSCEPFTGPAMSAEYDQDHLQKIAPPCLTALCKIREATTLLRSRFCVSLSDLARPLQPISQPGRFAHHYVLPLSSCRGRNERIFLGKSEDGLVELRDRLGAAQTSIHAASHNYTGLYGHGLDLLHNTIDRLPIIIDSGSQYLEDAMHQAVAAYFQVDFCSSASTGYGINLLAMGAILTEEWLVLIDEKSHNSMFVAVYLAKPGRIRRFRHNDMDHLHTILEQDRKSFRHTLVVIEGFYSMDGTTPNLGDLNSLKRSYDFALYVDEAHSLLAIGKTGRGCLEHWNDRTTLTKLPSDLIDLRVATISKSVGSVGGIVFGKRIFQDRIEQHRSAMGRMSAEPLTATACVHTIYALGQTNIICRNLARLKAMSIHCRQRLRDAGIFVYGEHDSPILPVFAGRPSRAAKLSYCLRRYGVIATPVSAPAVPFWESRVRITLSAAFSDDTVERLIHAILEATHDVGLCREKPRSWEPLDHEVIESIRYREKEDCKSRNDVNNLIMRATGTDEQGQRVEKAVAKMFSCNEALTYPDTYLGFISTVAALCRAVDGYRKHYLLVPEGAETAVSDRLRIAPRKGRPEMKRYHDHTALRRFLDGHARSDYITLVLDAQALDEASSIDTLLTDLGQTRAPANTTVLLIDSTHSATFAHLQLVSRTRKARLLTYGSFYHLLKLPGSFLAGDAVLLEELRYTSRGYMFTTSQQPYVMAMIGAELERLG
ncbi:hypothetical protein ACN47E_000730 [Coniothyrium glycines]